jgi:hypothetical protein
VAGVFEERKEKTMRVISMNELSRHSEKELSELFASVSQALVRTEPESPERRNALASLENIARARAAKPRNSGPGP